MKNDEKDKGKEDLSRTAGLPLIYSNAMDRDTLIAASRSRCSVDREDGIARGRERRGWALEMGSHSAPPSANGGRRRLLHVPDFSAHHSGFLQGIHRFICPHGPPARCTPPGANPPHSLLSTIIVICWAHGASWRCCYLLHVPLTLLYSGTCMLSRSLGPWRP